MKRKRMLIAVGALSAALAACSGEVDGDVPVAGAAPGAGAGGMAGSSGAAGTAGAAGNGGPPGTCVQGIPGTSQIPRLLNRQYEAVVRDLLGVTGVGTDNTAASELLVADSDGPM